LLLAILDGILAHRDLLLRGQLHGDISIDHIVIIARGKSPTPAASQHPFGKAFVGSAVLLDSDQSIPWRDAPRRQSSWYPANISFMSARMAELGLSCYGYVQTVADDLESLLWVLVCCVLLISKTCGLQSPEERNWLLSYFSDRAGTSWGRDYLLRKVVLEDKGAGPAMRAFAPVVRAWFNIARKSGEDVEKIIADGRIPDEDFCEGLYKRYMLSGVECLKCIPRRWDELNLAVTP